MLTNRTDYTDHAPFADHTDHFKKSDSKPNNLLFETALTVIILGVGIGFFADKMGMMGSTHLESNGYHGFTTVNVGHHHGHGLAAE